MSVPHPAVVLAASFDGHELKYLFPTNPNLNHEDQPYLFSFDIYTIFLRSSGAPPSGTFEKRYPMAPLALLGIEATDESLLGQGWQELKRVFAENLDVIRDEDRIAKLQFHVSILEEAVGKDLEEFMQLVESKLEDGNELCRKVVETITAIDSSLHELTNFRNIWILWYSGDPPRDTVLSSRIQDTILHDFGIAKEIVRTIITKSKNNTETAELRILALQTKLQALKNQFESIEERKAFSSLLEAMEDNHVLRQVHDYLWHHLRLLKSEEAEWKDPCSRLASPLGITHSHTAILPGCDMGELMDNADAEEPMDNMSREIEGEKQD
ncbi:hypothetical protein CALVIDRAFT_561069 [Calocera viscosa TUFC12733]|uniref:Uncharacterized protein n=1 Tax=Calocera viscosa (strain TUFC12733) TaxID=1330018 RepID=A0A167QGN6_CALVF|nr:hypothetical protein CALVIDRAFT_561069 [Calocera viscosa TUFC12733]